jgi:hypothetical protein
MMMQEPQGLKPDIAKEIADAAAPSGDMPARRSEPRPRRNPYLDKESPFDLANTSKAVPIVDNTEPINRKPRPLKDKRMNPNDLVEKGTVINAECPDITSELQDEGIPEYFATKLQNVLETSQPHQSLDYDVIVDTLAAFFAEEETQTVETNLNILRELVEGDGTITGDVDLARTALAAISEIIAKHFPFRKEDGGELEKGSTIQNVQGFVERQHDPDNENIILDCKLPTILLWRLLERHFIRPQVLIRYSTSVPNLSAHPQLYFPISSERKPNAADDESIPVGLMTDFTTEGKGFRVVNIFDDRSLRSNEDYSFALPLSMHVEAVISQLDVFYFAASLVYELKNQNIVASREVYSILKKAIPAKTLNDTEPALSQYINHLIIV